MKKEIAAFTFKANVIIPFILCILQTGLALGNDSIPSTKELEELVVTGERAWVEAGKINFVPTKKEKQLSDSPESLLRGMHLPVLRERDGKLVGLSGENIVYFINGVRAEKTDISTFLSRNVKTVQYIQNPTEPGYEGVALAINFIMDEYEIGGVTRVGLRQSWPLYSIPEVASKLVYKNLTFGVGFDGFFNRDKPQTEITESTYRGMYYGGERYEEVTGTDRSETTHRSDAYSLVFNARYAKKNFSAVHAVAMSWYRITDHGSATLSDFHPPILNANEEIRSSSKREFSPRLSGIYKSHLAEKWYLGASWNYAFMKNADFSSYRLGDNPEIANDIDERVNSFNTSLWAFFLPTKKWTFQLSASYGLKNYSTVYAGSADTSAGQNLHSLSGVLRAQWRPSDAFFILVSPGVSGYMRKVGKEGYNEFYPTVEGSFNWSANRKVSVSGGVGYYLEPASASNTNPVLTRVSELLWTEGNSSLKNRVLWDTRINVTYLPQDWLSLSLYASYFIGDNSFADVYYPASKEMGGLVKKNVNLPRYQSVFSDLSINGNFFSNTLSVTLIPGWSYDKVCDYYGGPDRHLSKFKFSANVDYTLRNVRFGVRYQSKHKIIKCLETYELPDMWDFNFTYGVKNILLTFSVQNAFHTKWDRKIWYESPAFRSYKFNQLTGRSFNLSFTYTFDYGKKVDRSIDLNAPGRVDSSINH